MLARNLDISHIGFFVAQTDGRAGGRAAVGSRDYQIFSIRLRSHARGAQLLCFHQRMLLPVADITDIRTFTSVLLGRKDINIH